MPYTRRDFLKGMGSFGAIGVSKSLFPSWMPRLAFRQPSSAPGDVLVAIFLRGGIDGLSAVVPYGDGRHYYDARPSLALPEPGSDKNAVVDLDGYFGFHQSLASLYDIYSAGNLAVVHATGSIDPSRSHFDAMQFMEYGTPGSKGGGTGWVGRHLESAAWQNDSPFRAVGMGAMVPSSLRGRVSPLSMRSIADFHLKGREGELRRAEQVLSQLYAVDAPAGMLDTQAKVVFDTVDMLRSLNVESYQPDNEADYPNDDEGFGQGLKQIAQLIKSDVGLEVACLDLGGWDTHENQGTHGGFFSDHLSILGRSLSAFYADLGDHINNVTVVTMSEFGRRVAENASNGTDHGHGNFMLLMGGGVKGGKVYSNWPTLAPDALNDGDLAITTDYRDVLAEVISQRLKNPSVEQVFPNFTHTPLGLVVPR
ncbi:MAG: DUF1501 domain-containing protein [Chloroflexi bacterium]|nr:DUF1501 domain-containing protein [Chloroflexota bacterium]MCC6895727.1 DUF1501 domain-containing protein [Anaerolineae bacterium]